MSLPFESSSSRFPHQPPMMAAVSSRSTTKYLSPGNTANHKVDLFSVANFVNVPVVLAAYQDENGAEVFAAHGMTLTENLTTFATACIALCEKGVIVVPDTHVHPRLGRIARQWPVYDIRFMVAIPLRNAARKYVGCLAVMNTSKAVSLKGISFANLMAVGNGFAATGNLQGIATVR